MASSVGFYHQPVTCQMVGDWATGIEQIDIEMANLRTVMGLTRYLIAVLPQGNVIITGAEKRVQDLGQIPAGVLNRLDKLDWTNGMPDRIAHLQIVWRYYLAFEQRRSIRALRGELAKQVWFSGTRYTNLLSSMRGNQRTIYRELEKQGFNPYQLDPLLDQDVDPIEWLLELRLWHYLSSQYDQNGLVREGLYQWWLAEKSAADTMTSEPSQPIGHPQTVFTDILTLQHGIHDAKVKAIVTMGMLAADNNLSTDTLTQFMVKVMETRREGLDQAALGMLLAAIELAFKDVDPQKIDTAADAAAAIIQRQMAQDTKPNHTRGEQERQGCLPRFLRQTRPSESNSKRSWLLFQQACDHAESRKADESLKWLYACIQLEPNNLDA